MSSDVTVIHGDCLDVLPTLADVSVDAVICDPPYPCIDRPYGRLTEAEWHAMMRGVVAECRRILKPCGSAVFILQPNWKCVGSTRLWLWEFMVWAGKEWNLIQDVYWWNTTALPKCGKVRDRVLPRPSVKSCVWLGPSNCYRDIDEVLIDASDSVNDSISDNRAISRPPSGWQGNGKPRFHRRFHMRHSAIARGGSTPFNLLPIANNDPDHKGGGGLGHGAATPLDLCDWWVRYISPPDGVVCDPFMGSGTTGLAAIRRGRSFIGIEKEPDYVAIARRRLDGPPMPLFDDVPDVAPDPTPLFAAMEAGDR